MKSTYTKWEGISNLQSNGIPSELCSGSGDCDFVHFFLPLLLPVIYVKRRFESILVNTFENVAVEEPELLKCVLLSSDTNEPVEFP